MNSFIKYFLGVFTIIIGIVYFTKPSGVQVTEFLVLIFLLSACSFFFIPKFISRVKSVNGKINLGLIFFGAMVLIQIVGNISTYVVKTVYPKFDDYLMPTNLYWISGIIFFSVGFIIMLRFNKKKTIQSKKYYPLKINYITFLFIATFLATLYAFSKIGLIPFIKGTGTGERFFSYGSSTIANRIWAYCVVVAVMSFIYIKQHKRNVSLWIFLAGSIINSMFFLVRMYPMLIFASIVMIWLSLETKKLKVLLFSIPVIISFFIINVYLADYRNHIGTDSKVEESSELNFIQAKLIYGTFNEFGQLKRAINEYDEKPQYGKTLLSIPLGFIPAPLLYVVGVEKSKIQNNNSAVIMAEFINSKTSWGIRIGLLGEFYINFKLFGGIFMVFIGLFVGYIQIQLSKISNTDWRYCFLIIFFCILLYSLIGQINAIGSLLGNYLLLFLILMIFTKRYKIIKTNNED